MGWAPLLTSSTTAGTYTNLLIWQTVSFGCGGGDPNWTSASKVPSAFFTYQALTGANGLVVSGCTSSAAYVYPSL